MKLDTGHFCSHDPKYCYRCKKRNVEWRVQVQDRYYCTWFCMRAIELSKGIGDT